MGKASKKKSGRRTGLGPSRAEIESRAARELGQRRVAAGHQPDRVAEAMRQVAEQAAAALRIADDAVAELWGAATPAPAEEPQWEGGSRGHFFFTEPVIVAAAAAPPAEVAVLPPPERMFADGSMREAVASV